MVWLVSRADLSIFHAAGSAFWGSVFESAVCAIAPIENSARQQIENITRFIFIKCLLFLNPPTRCQRSILIPLSYTELDELSTDLDRKRVFGLQIRVAGAMIEIGRSVSASGPIDRS